MALGTYTILKKGVLAPGGLRYVIANLQATTGANYTANGEALTIASLSGNYFRRGILHYVQITAKDEASGATDLIYDHTNKKVLAFDAATGVEEAASQDLSAMTYRVFAIGE